jgi:hypothetical protein
VRQVVDIFGSAGEVDEFADGMYFRVAVEAFLEPVFQCLDVVIGAAFDSLDLCCLGFSEAVNRLGQFLDGGCAERGNLL